jgi:hypothetical protein
MTWISVDIDLDEVISSLRKKDIEYLIECLIEDGHLDKRFPNDNEPMHFEELDWRRRIENLKLNRHRLTKEEEQTILTIAEKL